MALLLPARSKANLNQRLITDQIHHIISTTERFCAYLLGELDELEMEAP